MPRLRAAPFCVSLLMLLQTIATAADNTPPIVQKVSAQPLTAQAKQVMEAMEFLGNPAPDATKEAIEAAVKQGDQAKIIEAIQQALDPLCIAMVSINPESRVKVAAGPAAPELVEQGWRQFLVKVHNEAGVTTELKADCAQALPLFNAKRDTVMDRWLEIQMFGGRPVQPKLSGLEVEYRIIQLYSRDAGKRMATLSFNVGQGTQDIGFRSEASILFVAAPATKVALEVLDDDGSATTAGLVIRDRVGRTYPSQAKRLAPDFAFHPQIYRHSGESLLLPDGEYEITSSRGPEYLIGTQKLTVGKEPAQVSVRLKRWVDPSKMGWWSGDHHIHAAGCAHYTNPTEGVLAADMIRHCVGEDLKVGCNLTWGPCFDYQKQFFTGGVDKVSSYPYLLRYDIEVSGFGSHQSGHLVLLRLKDQMFPGGDSDKHWPTLGLNTLKWAKKQGAVCGPAHSGNGLDVRGAELPSDSIPPYNGIGANEYIVDITHQVPGPDGKDVPAIDFISTVDTNAQSELNMWYHTLNVGYRVRASGETDFPCITGERVGMGRSYVKLDGKLDFDSWCEGIRHGRCYVSEGRSHLIDFAVGEVKVGVGESELKLAAPGMVKATAQVAAFLPEKPTPAPDRRGLSSWNLEKARIPDTRDVKVEVVVNGQSVGSKAIVADGTMREVSFDVKIDKSSWMAMRILPSSHTNPVFVIVDGKPVRASKKSAEWCLKGVDQCWSQKERFYAAAEMNDAKAAYEHARTEYRRLVQECAGE